MYLKRLEIQGFKSFAKKTTLEFEQGITAIVGPNGSGKSNVADCLRWVLGEQSAKLMRGKKSDDVIFAGSDKKVRAGFAEVVATFDNRDHKIPLDYSEVSIGRRIDRSGESEYLINGNRVRLLDIVDLVLKSNIGTSRYTVIGQGTIDQMILAGPAEIKNLLDEASGVKTYYIRRDKTLRRLEQTAQNLMRAEDLIKELEPRVKSLRRQAKRMEARETIEQELKTYQKEFLGGKYWQLKDQQGKIVVQLQDFRSQREQAESGMQAHLQKIEQHEKDNADQLAGFQEQQRVIQGLQQQKNGLLENLSLIRGKMQSQKTPGASDSASLQVQHHTLTQRLEELRKQLTQAENEMEQIKNQSSKRQEDLGRLNEQFNKVYEMLQQPVAADWPRLEKQLRELEQSFEGFYQFVDEAEEISSVRAKLQDLRTQWQRFREAIKDATSPEHDRSAMQSELRELAQKKDSLNVELGNFSVSLSKASMSREFLQQQIGKTEQELLQVNLDVQKMSSDSTDSFVQNLVTQEGEIQKQIDNLQQKIEQVEQRLQSYYDRENQWKNSIADEDKKFRELQQRAGQIRDRQSALEVDKAKIDVQLETIWTEINQSLGQSLADEIMKNPLPLSQSQTEDKIVKLKHQLELIGGVDELTLQEYHETEGRYANLTNQVNDLKKSMDDLRAIMDELDEHIKTKFNEAFHKINGQFENYFRVLFNGGRAYLSLVKAGEERIVEEEQEEEQEDDGSGQLRPEEKLVARYEKGSFNIIGVDIKATPPGKKLSTIQALSGGERALTSIALLCSLLACFPSPFVVLDEVDAALDEANTIRFGQILGTLAHQTQFITITHNRETMAQSNTLYGVTMGDDGISKLLSIKLEQARVYAK